MLSLELNSSHISQAVNAYIDHKVEELANSKRYDEQLKCQVRDQLFAKADATFLWISLACKSLEKVRLRRNTLKMLQDLPVGLISLYSRMMQYINEIEDVESRDFCLQVLRSVVVALRPLALSELIVVSNLPHDFLDDLADVEQLLEHCGSFITIRHGVAYFVHQSAKEFLIADEAQNRLTFSNNTEHGLVCRRSLDFISGILEIDMCKLKEPGTLISELALNTNSKLNNIEYSCCYWVDHLAIYLSGCENHGQEYREFLSKGGRVNTFFLNHLLNWVEALSLMEQVHTGILALRKLTTIVDVSIIIF
jgi:hypothetical protein